MLSAAAGFYRICQLTQQGFGIFPADTGISHTLAVYKRRITFQVLVPFLKVAFHHHTHNGFLTTGNLLCHIGTHIHLTLVLFAAVSVAEIDHDTRCQTGLCQPFFYRTDIFRAVVFYRHAE